MRNHPSLRKKILLICQLIRYLPDILHSQNVAIINNNDLKLLPSGREKFNDLFEEIKKAKHHIHLEYFNFRNDSIGNALFDLLAEKVKDGVKVRAMFDAFGNMSNNRPLRKRLLKDLSKRGIELLHSTLLLSRMLIMQPVVTTKKL